MEFGTILFFLTSLFHGNIFAAFGCIVLILVLISIFCTLSSTHRPKVTASATQQSPPASTKRTTISPSIFVSQYNHLLEDSYDILTTTNNPKTFRSRLDFCTQKLDELQSSCNAPEAHRIYEYYHPLITGDNLSTLISDCRSRYYDKAVSELKTASGIGKRMQNFDAIMGVSPAPAVLLSALLRYQLRLHISTLPKVTLRSIQMEVLLPMTRFLILLSWEENMQERQKEILRILSFIAPK